MFTNILKENSNVSCLILWSIFILNILLFLKTTPKEND